MLEEHAGKATVRLLLRCPGLFSFSACEIPLLTTSGLLNMLACYCTAGSMLCGAESCDSLALDLY